nr:type II toxin-antitoxin system RelE/ParE family toxin [Mitsuokella multacida]
MINCSTSFYNEPFFFLGGKIIITNGFVKKTNKTPPKEICLAKKRRADYLQRQEES